jgi:hypothetical protein
MAEGTELLVASEGSLGTGQGPAFGVRLSLKGGGPIGVASPSFSMGCARLGFLALSPYEVKGDSVPPSVGGPQEIRIPNGPSEKGMWVPSR